MDQDEIFMRRCFELARYGLGTTAPNPIVGAVLVHGDRIIGEGFHQEYGKAHAEVNCLNSVADADKPLIRESRLYVSLEPCAHHGKTPPCTRLIIQNQIPQVIVGCRDPFELVNGRGMEQLRQAGIKVKESPLAPEARQVNKRFFTFHEQQRPYVILKWAQTADAKISGEHQQPLAISNDYSNRLVHRWRMEEAGILIGTQTALSDNPQLTNRYWPGPNPIRLVIDLKLRLPGTLQLFRDHPTIIFNHSKHEDSGNLQYYKLDPHQNLVAALMQALHELKILSVLVEGGSRLLQTFLDANCWDEARIITNESLLAGQGVDAPAFAQDQPDRLLMAGNDRIAFFSNPRTIEA